MSLETAGNFFTRRIILRLQVVEVHAGSRAEHRAVATGEFGGALFLVGFAALFGWQIGGFIRRNRPQTYTFDQLPAALLP
jgi:hypothetical protein